MESARNYIGKLAYRDWRNGEEKNPWNATCAEFVTYPLIDIGIQNFPEHCWRQWVALPKTGSPEKGDLVFTFETPYSHFPNHVGIYTDKGVLHCSREAGGVTEDELGVFALSARYKKLRYASLEGNFQ